MGKHKVSRILSLSVIGAYLVWGATGGMLGFIQMLAFVYVPFSLIWFSDRLGSMTGFGPRGGPRVNKKTPGSVVAFMGWVFLLLPLIFSFYMKYKWNISVFDFAVTAYTI